MRIIKPLRALLNLALAVVVTAISVRFGGFGYVLVFPVAFFFASIAVDAFDFWLRKQTRDAWWLATGQADSWLASEEGKQWLATEDGERFAEGRQGR